VIVSIVNVTRASASSTKCVSSRRRSRSIEAK
jgi:hypothetical protein